MKQDGRKPILVAILAGLAGCTDLKALQAQLNELQNQVARLQADAQSEHQAADAEQCEVAQAARSTADQALAAAQAAQTCCASTNEKINRMFQRHFER